MDDATLINGLLAKRIELHGINAELREKMAVVANDIEAVERVLDSLGYQGEAVTTPRAARIVLFYRNELREYLCLWAPIFRDRGPCRCAATGCYRRIPVRPSVIAS